MNKIQWQVIQVFVELHYIISFKDKHALYKFDSLTEWRLKKENIS